MHEKIAQYIRTWETRGYADGIPDTVPDQLMQECLAPSYRAIAFAILRNDHPLQSLGFTPKPSPWYSTIKQSEIAAQSRKEDVMEGLNIAIGRSGEIAKFWANLGPLVASRQVANIVREPIFDDDKTIWFIAQDKDNMIHGFCAAHLGKTTAALKYHWNIDGKNGEPIMRMLCEARHKHLSSDHGALRQSIATRSKAIIEQMKTYGFIQSGKKGQITILHSTAVRQPRAARHVKTKKVHAVKVKTTAQKTFRPAPKPSRRATS